MLRDDSNLFASTTAPLPPVSRGTDPDTSHAAERSLSKEARSAMMSRLLAAVRERPMTSEEASAAAGITGWQGSKRMSDLANKGLIVDSGARRAGSSGRMQIVWNHTGE